jgi:hypothetical protein
MERHNDTLLFDDWGWYIDIDIDIEPITVFHHIYKNKHIHSRKILPTIYEEPTVKTTPTQMQDYKNTILKYTQIYNNNIYTLYTRMRNKVSGIITTYTAFKLCFPH